MICHHVGGMEEVNALEDIIIQRFGYSLSCNPTFGYQLWEILPSHYKNDLCCQNH
jgi:hypothetical protein